MGSNSNITTQTHTVSPRYGDAESTTTDSSTASQTQVDNLSATVSSLSSSVTDARDGSTTTSSSGDDVLAQVDQQLAQDSQSTQTTQAPEASQTTQADFPTGVDGLKGIGDGLKERIADVDEMIANQIKKYEGMLEKEDSPQVKQKLRFWKQEQNMQEKIKKRLRGQGVQEGLKKAFNNNFSNRTRMLKNKAKQGPIADNKGKYYENLAKTNSILTQLASGSTGKEIKKNMRLTNLLAKKVGEQHDEVRDLDDKINKLRKELKKKGISDKRKENIKKKLKELNTKRNTERLKYQKLKQTSKRHGGRAHRYSDLDRAQVRGFIRDIFVLDGDVDMDMLP